VSGLLAGWSAATLGDLVKLRGEKRSPQELSDTPYVGLEHVEPHTSRLLGHARADELKSSGAVFSEGELLYSRLRPYLNKVWLADRDGIASAEFLVFQAAGGSSMEFVRRRIMSDDFLAFTASLDKGDRPRVDYDQIRAFPVAVPPLPEQQRIVAKLDALTARTARARADLDRIPALAARYRQTVLEKGFTGRLTAIAGGVRVGWTEATIAQLAQVGTGSTPRRGERRYYEGGTIPWVTSSVVNRASVEAAEQFITEAAIQETNCKVFQPGTLLVAMYGEGQTRGRVTVLGIEAATNQALAAISPTANSPIQSSFLYWFLRSKYLSLRSEASGGVQPNLNLGMIKATEVPVPPLAEQMEIVRRIESAFAEIDRLTAEAAAARRLLDRLDQAVLAKAFRGELVPQDPADEPAAVLLDRIRAERAAAPKAKRGRKVAA
jgi:type I restriction enzyme S subunit